MSMLDKLKKMVRPDRKSEFQKRQDVYRKDPVLLMEDAKNRTIKDVKSIYKPVRKIKTDSIKEDGFLNLYTGVGTSRDKTRYTSFSNYTYLTDQVLTDLWVGDGFGKRIIEVVADDMTREWINIPEDTNQIILNKMEDLEAETQFNEVLKMKGLYNGSVIVIGLNDGNPLEEPVNLNTIKSVDWLRVYDRTEINLTTFNFNRDPNSKRFGKPEFYTINSNYSEYFNVHYSRVIEFKGLKVPSSIEQGNWWYWGMSQLQPIWTQLKDFGAGVANISKLLYEFVIGKYKIKNLSQMMAEDNWDKVKKIIDIVDLGKSMIQAHLLDADGEDFSRDSVSVSGLPDLLDRFMMFLSGVTGIPVTRLYGRSPAGENATGEADLMNYYDMIASRQKTELKSKIQMLVDYINLSQEITQKIDNPTVEFNSLFQTDEKAEIENKKTFTEMVMQWYDRNLITDEEARSVLENGFTFDIEITDEWEPVEEENITVTPPQVSEEEGEPNEEGE